MLQQRLLLCLYGLGTNAGLKRMCSGGGEDSYADLHYVRRRFITKEHLRAAIAQVCNAIFRVRHPDFWGEGTTACASDSKKFGAWDQNLMTEWHVRYGGPGVMIYWHVEKNSVCIYSQLKACSSSEVAAMIEGVLRHCTEMDVEKQYVDTHGQSEVAFAFCHLLGFAAAAAAEEPQEAEALPAPEGTSPDKYANLQPILTRPINWELIEQQYDEMIKYATALRLGTADAESILRRFTRNNVQHPTYKALCELGKALKTIFLCDYLQLESLRREIHEGLNVIENWNSANDFIFYGKGGEFASNRLEDQEILMLSLHLLQVSLVYVNTLMIQQVLAEPAWQGRLTAVDLRALSPLKWQHVNPYGTFTLNMQERLPLEQAAQLPALLCRNLGLRYLKAQLKREEANAVLNYNSLLERPIGRPWFRLLCRTTRRSAAGYLASRANTNMFSPRSKTAGSGPSGFGSARHVPLALPRCTLRRCNLNRGAPPRLQRCRSFSSASSRRTRAWRQRDRDRLPLWSERSA